MDVRPAIELVLSLLVQTGKNTYCIFYGMDEIPYGVWNSLEYWNGKSKQAFWEGSLC
jgi:hypothetical protein